MHPIMAFIGNLGYVIISIIGGYFTIKGKIEIGDIQSFITGDPSPYINPRRNSYEHGYKNPISGASISFWDIFASFLII